MENITERIRIIDSFIILFGDRNKPIENRLRINKIFLVFYIVLILVVAIGILFSLVVETFSIESKYNWSRASFFVLLSINFLNLICNQFYKKVLLEHLRFLQRPIKITFDKNLNQELESILEKIEKPNKRDVIISFSLVTIVLVGIIFNFFGDHKILYYKYLIIPTLFFYAFTIFNAVKNYNNIKSNTQQLEVANTT